MLRIRLSKFPDNALIKRQAKELSAVEQMPIAEFLKLYEPDLKPKHVSSPRKGTTHHGR